MVFPIISIGKEEINTISLIWEYFGSHMGDYLTVLREHVVISLMALAISVLLGISIGYVCVRTPKLEKWLVGTFQTLRIVPSLAILILLIPLLGSGSAGIAGGSVHTAQYSYRVDGSAGFYAGNGERIGNDRKAGDVPREVSDGISPHHDRCEDRHDRDRGQCCPCG